MGCGTGISTLVAARFAGSSGSVIGIDPADQMVELAKRKLGNLNSPDNIRFALAKAEELPFPDGCFDVVICNFGPHLFEDQVRGVMEMKRVLKPGGRIGWTPPGPYHVQELLDVFTEVLKDKGLFDEFTIGRPLKPKLPREEIEVQRCKPLFSDERYANNRDKLLKMIEEAGFILGTRHTN